MKRELQALQSGKSDPPDDFIVPLNDPNEEITEQWQDGLHDGYICRDGVQSSPPESPVMSSRGEAATTSVRIPNGCWFRQHKQ